MVADSNFHSKVIGFGRVFSLNFITCSTFQFISYCDAFMHVDVMMTEVR